MHDRLIAADGEPVPVANADLWRRRTARIYDLPPADVSMLGDAIDHGEFSLWRYRAALPFDDSSQAWRDVTLGEGATPLVDGGAALRGLKLKVEYAMPTLSFKDRGAAVMIAKALEWNVEHVVIDSSGNAGTAVAAYSARAGISCEVFVPADASAGKLIQMERHGARVHRIDGSRSAAARAAQQFVEDHGTFYASHVFNPYFHEGTKTLAYELWEQLGFRAPDHLYLPVGHGTLLLGAYKGFVELLRAGLVDRLPVLHAAQAEGCAPIADAFARNERTVSAVESSGTSAEGIAIADPPRGFQILSAVRVTHGDLITVTDLEIRHARDELAQMGFFVEPTAAVTFAAYRKTQRPARAVAGAVSVVPLSGAGLKAPAA